MSPRRPAHLNPRPRRLVMTLLVRNEADILAANLRFHYARGVDFVVAADNGSTDGTTDILEQFRREGRLAWRREPGDDYAQARWVMRLVETARREHGADWVLLSDADEFWRPDTGDLKDAIAAAPQGVLHGARRNLVRVLGAGADDDARPLARHDYLEVVRPWREPGWLAKRLLGKKPPPGADSWVFKYDKPKIVARAAAVLAVEQGNHEVRTAGRERRGPLPGVCIRHFPVRSYAQFAAKVRAGGAAYARNTELPPSAGGHWRRWFALWQEGRLPEEYRQLVINGPAEARALLAAGIVRTPPERFWDESPPKSTSSREL